MKIWKTKKTFDALEWLAAMPACACPHLSACNAQAGPEYPEMFPSWLLSGRQTPTTTWTGFSLDTQGQNPLYSVPVKPSSYYLTRPPYTTPRILEQEPANHHTPSQWPFPGRWIKHLLQITKAMLSFRFNFEIITGPLPIHAIGWINKPMSPSFSPS